MENITQALSWRYATKKFDSTKKLSSDQLDFIAEAIRMAPTSFGLQPFRLVVVEDQQLREQLKAVSWNQEQITSASHLLVFAVLKDIGEKEINNYINLIASERNVNVSDLEGFKGMMANLFNLSVEQKIEWAKKQAYIALGVALLSAAESKIDACPMEGFTPSEYDRILGLEEKGLTTAVIMTIGYRALDDDYQKLKKVRLPKSEFVN